MSERRLKGGHFDSDHSPGPQINNKPLTEKYAVQLETQSAIVDNNEMTLHEAANPEQLAAFNKHEEQALNTVSYLRPVNSRDNTIVHVYNWQSDSGANTSQDEGQVNVRNIAHHRMKQKIESLRSGKNVQLQNRSESIQYAQGNNSTANKRAIQAMRKSQYPRDKSKSKSPPKRTSLSPAKSTQKKTTSKQTHLDAIAD